jgi:hypothetical protein
MREFHASLSVDQVEFVLDASATADMTNDGTLKPRSVPDTQDRERSRQQLRIAAFNLNIHFNLHINFNEGLLLISFDIQYRHILKYKRHTNGDI